MVVCGTTSSKLLGRCTRQSPRLRTRGLDIPTTARNNLSSDSNADDEPKSNMYDGATDKSHDDTPEAHQYPRAVRGRSNSREHVTAAHSHGAPDAVQSSVLLSCFVLPIVQDCLASFPEVSQWVLVASHRHL